MISRGKFQHCQSKLGVISHKDIAHIQHRLQLLHYFSLKDCHGKNWLNQMYLETGSVHTNWDSTLFFVLKTSLIHTKQYHIIVFYSLFRLFYLQG